MIILILLAQLAATAHGAFPIPQWTAKPVPHWSCPAGWYIPYQMNPPLCAKANAFMGRTMGYDPEREEQISWGWVKTVPPSGKLRIEYAADFVRQPGCDVTDKTDEATNRVRFSEESKAGVTLHAAPGHKLHLNCHGVIQRPVERSTN